MHNFLNIGLAFLEGLALIVSPCILPVLPILLSASLTGSRKRPFGIIVGFVCTFALFTFFSRALVAHLNIDLTWLRYASYAFLLIFGVVMLSTVLTERFALLTNIFAQAGSKLSSKTAQDGFGSGLILGSLVGLIWTPCAGPILAAVIVQTAIQQSDTEGFLTMLSFGIGAGVPMLLIALFGRGLMKRLSFFNTHARAVRQTLGVVILCAVGYLILSETSAFTAIDAKATGDIKALPEIKSEASSLKSGLPKPYPAPDFAGITAWINSPAKQIGDFKGKVVLIDFWTYSCINCIRTLPYIKNWYAKYHDQGFEVIGVHTPEFEFEKSLDNVQMAVKKFEILYPVALDPNYGTWKNYNNGYWPAHYLIDKTGTIVYTHFGEGDDDITENNIRFLLGIKGASSPSSTATDLDDERHQTPETYMGYSRSEDFASPEEKKAGKAIKYSFPKKLAVDHWALQNSWLIEPERIIAKEANAALQLHFEAKKVFVVIGNGTGKIIHVKAQLNGADLIKENGSDVKDGKLEVKEHRLYEILDLSKPSTGILQIIALEPGLEIYAFTFGD